MKWNLNIDESDLDKPIYRIIDFDRLISILKTGSVELNHPNIWNDPFEDLLNKISFIKEGRSFSDPSLSFIYAQCWSYSEENDLLWRVYSKGDGVRIKSTPRKLINSLLESDFFKQVNDKPKIVETIPIDDETGKIGYEPLKEDIDCYIGNVKYADKESIIYYLQNESYSNRYEAIMNSLILKRKPFANEEEVRLLVYHFQGPIFEMCSDRLEFNFDINEVYDEIVFDPRISIVRFEAFGKTIRQEEYNNPIYRSKIYDKPEEILIKLD